MMNKSNLEDIKSFVYILTTILSVLVIYTYIQTKTLNLLLCFIIIALLGILFSKPTLLTPVYTKWIQIGEIIGGYVSKIALAILFFTIFTPIAYILRLFHIQLLDKTIDSSNSYWIERQTPPNPMKYQF